MKYFIISLLICFVGFWLLLFFGLCSLQADIVAQPQNHRSEKLVLAFYYPWYGTPPGSGKNILGSVIGHWAEVDPEKKDISNSRRYPQMGAYDSHDDAVLKQHCKWARQAGIDALIASWWGHGTYEDRAIPLILNACQESSLKCCIYYEITPRATPETTAKDIIKVLRKYGDHPSYLRHKGQPVIFVFGRALMQMGFHAWFEALKQIREQYPPGLIAIGDQMSYACAKVFDGIHTYNTADQLSDKSVIEVRSWTVRTYPKWVKLARQAGKISTLTVIPGYDDTKIRKPGLKVERFDGSLYESQWKRVIAAGPDWILITSFNEWHEGSEIEPSLEHGEKYIELTGRFSALFKSSKVVQPLSVQPYTTTEKERLRKKLSQLKIAVLPQPNSNAFWWLMDMTEQMEVLSWEHLVEGKLRMAQYDMLLYCRGEDYVSTVSENRDVDKAISQYLSSGGTMLVLPDGPFPFFYDRGRKPVIRAEQFGLNIQMGWEKPPKGGPIFFVQPQAKLLKHVPNRFAFPKTGDLRWRPFTKSERYQKYTPLLQLTDRQGKTYGDGICIAKDKNGGSIVYVWFGLLRGSHGQKILFDLFDLMTNPPTR